MKVQGYNNYAKSGCIGKLFDFEGCLCAGMYECSCRIFLCLFRLPQKCCDEPSFTNYNLSRHTQKMEMQTYKIIPANYMRAILYAVR